jgi:hypothetical protein
MSDESDRTVSVETDGHQPPNIAEQFIPMFTDGRKYRVYSHSILQMARPWVNWQSFFKLCEWWQSLRLRQRRHALPLVHYRSQTWAARWSAYHTHVRGMTHGG